MRESLLRLYKCFSVLVFATFVSVLVGLLFGALFQPHGRVAAQSGHYNPWTADPGNATWDPIIEGLAPSDFDRLVDLIDTKARPMEKAHAAHELLRFMPVIAAPHDVMQRHSGLDAHAQDAFDKKYLETKKKDDEFRLAQLKVIHRLIDSADPGPERMASYMMLERQYRSVGAELEASSAFEQLADEIAKTGGVAQQLKNWFMPLFRDRIAMLACGVMAFCVYLWRPTFDVWAKARALRYHAGNPDPFVQKAIGETPPKVPRIIQPD